MKTLGAAVFWIFMCFVAVSFSPIGRAIARSIMRGGDRSFPGPFASAGRAGAADVEALRTEVGGLRQQLDDVQNRLDFAERLLAQARNKGALGAGAEPEGR